MRLFIRGSFTSFQTTRYSQSQSIKSHKERLCDYCHDPIKINEDVVQTIGHSKWGSVCMSFYHQVCAISKFGLEHVVDWCLIAENTKRLKQGLPPYKKEEVMARVKVQLEKAGLEKLI